MNKKAFLNRRKRPKVDASIFESALSHTRRSDASEKREENSVSTFGRFRLWTSFKSLSVLVNDRNLIIKKQQKLLIRISNPNYLGG